MKKSILEMDIVEILRMQAGHIADQGINGWGNTMSAAADEIERLRRERDEALARWDEAVNFYPDLEDLVKTRRR